MKMTQVFDYGVLYSDDDKFLPDDFSAHVEANNDSYISFYPNSKPCPFNGKFDGFSPEMFNKIKERLLADGMIMEEGEYFSVLINVSW